MNSNKIVAVAKDGSSKINVTSEIDMSKRYLKYLTKKYLKLNQIKDYLHVIATNSSTYEVNSSSISQVRYYNVDSNE